MNINDFAKPTSGYPFGGGRTRIVACLRDFATRIESGELEVKAVTTVGEVRINDWTLQTLTVTYVEKLAPDAQDSHPKPALNPDVASALNDAMKAKW